ncbi:MAG: oxidoreductase [Candidatus Aenigmarchaeota archaeon]|nr:oxidoreductase [Candidatus Aenigmarchaeota archaeon]
MPIVEQKLKLKAVADETHDVKLFVFDTKGKHVDFIAGQYFALSTEVPGKGLVTRFYSTASPPTDKDNLEFQIKLYPEGALTPRMFHMKVGDEMVVKGPMGKFTYTEAMGKNVAFLGAGSGLAPLRCIAKYCLDKNLDNNLTLLFSNKMENDIISRKELDELSRKHKNLKVYYTLTRENPAGWKGFTKRIDADMIKSLVPHYMETLYYICGAPEFSKNMKEMLLSLGIDKEKIKVEVF